jgi:hypothetical protein
MPDGQATELQGHGTVLESRVDAAYPANVDVSATCEDLLGGALAGRHLVHAAAQMLIRRLRCARRCTRWGVVASSC